MATKSQQKRRALYGFQTEREQSMAERIPWQLRFWMKVKPVESGCWEWQGTKDKYGYGRFTGTGELRPRSHRFAYRQFVGEIPEGHEVMHVCDNRACVRLEHLRLGTHADNMRDMSLKGRSVENGLSARTHCKRGHPFSGDNLYFRKRVRCCRACARQMKHDAWHKRHEQKHSQA